MSRSVLLNNVQHKDLRILKRRGAAYGDDVMTAVAVAAEFRNLQAHYPIVFQKTTTGVGFQPVALLGLQEGQNLFLTPAGWDAHHVPMAIERQPFLIGRDGEELLIHVDLDSPRISCGDDGEPVFLPHGGTTDFIERMNSLLLAIHEGLQTTPAFIDALLRHELLESFVLDVELADGSHNRVAGLYTIDEERLRDLPADALVQLHAAGYLQAIFMAVASLSNLRDLIERHDARIRGR
jgi:hypothetical protein